MLHRARRRAPSLPLVCLDARALPFQTGSLDAVTLHSVLYLLADQHAALREMFRVLRPGGRADPARAARGGGRDVLGLLRALPRRAGR